MIKEMFWGNTREGKVAKRYILSNENGMEVELSDFGASILALKVPDRSGTMVDVMLGYDTIDEYYDNSCGFGAYIGRNANRIGEAKVEIEGIIYTLEANSKDINNLHSGNNRSHYHHYETEKGQCIEGEYVEFSRVSPHLEQGFPGNLQQKIRYVLSPDNELQIQYYMVSDASTVINVTNHSYFNLSGHDSGDILSHELIVCSDKFLLCDENLLPTGEIAKVEGTPMDFRQMHLVGERINEDFEPLKFAGGYDHNYILPNDKQMRKAAWVRSSATGIVMEVWTDLCGMQVYSGNFLNHKKGKRGTFYEKNSGICFETQFYPNSCKEKAFPSCIFGPGEVLETTTIYKFSIQ